MANAVPRHAIRAIVRGVFDLILVKPPFAPIEANLYQQSGRTDNRLVGWTPGFFGARSEKRIPPPMGFRSCRVGGAGGAMSVLTQLSPSACAYEPNDLVGSFI